MLRGEKMPTMKDVAREAGVSLGTVSKVINGIAVGEAYRLRVEAASERLGYEVNSYARGLKTNKTGAVALILPSIRHPFFAALADALTAALMRADHRPLLMITNYDQEAERKCFTMVRQNKVDGIVALSYTEGMEIDRSIPFVSIDRYFDSDVPCVASDNFGGGRLAAERLCACGARRLLFLRIGASVPCAVDERQKGFESACREQGLPCESLSLRNEEGEEPIFRFLDARFTAEKPEFDGIFCNTDYLAVQVRDYLERRGVRVPEQVQIVGFDGLVDFPTKRYYCSTVVQPVEEMAESALSLLLREDRSALPERVTLPVRYAPGGTTREPVSLPR